MSMYPGCMFNSFVNEESSRELESQSRVAQPNVYTDVHREFCNSQTAKKTPNSFSSQTEKSQKTFSDRTGFWTLTSPFSLSKSQVTSTAEAATSSDPGSYCFVDVQVAKDVCDRLCLVFKLSTFFIRAQRRTHTSQWFSDVSLIQKGYRPFAFQSAFRSTHQNIWC